MEEKQFHVNVLAVDYFEPQCDVMFYVSFFSHAEYDKWRKEHPEYIVIRVRKL